MSIRTVPYRCHRRSAKSSTPSTSTVVVGGSGSAQTSRNKVEHPTETPSVDANLDPARPAKRQRDLLANFAQQRSGPYVSLGQYSRSIRQMCAGHSRCSSAETEAPAIRRYPIGQLCRAPPYLHSLRSITVRPRAGPFALDGLFRNFHRARKDEPVHFNPASATSIPTTTSRHIDHHSHNHEQLLLARSKPLVQRPGLPMSSVWASQEKNRTPYSFQRPQSLSRP